MVRVNGCICTKSCQCYLYGLYNLLHLCNTLNKSNTKSYYFQWFCKQAGWEEKGEEWGEGGGEGVREGERLKENFHKHSSSPFIWGATHFKVRCKTVFVRTRAKSNQPRYLLMLFFIFKITHCIHIQISLKFIHQTPVFQQLALIQHQKLQSVETQTQTSAMWSNNLSGPKLILRLAPFDPFLFMALQTQGCPDFRFMAHGLLPVNPIAFEEEFKIIWNEWNDRTAITAGK